MSFENLRRFCSRVRAGLTAHEALSARAAEWETAADDTLAVHVASMKSEDELEAAEVVERLAAHAWDRALRALSDRALELAGDPARAPYAELFGVVSAADAARLGPAKAALLGRDLVALGRRFVGDDAGLDSLKAHLAELEAATARLEAAAAAREHESDQRYAFALARAQLVRRLQRLADETRLAILRAFPGRGDLLAEILEHE